MIFKDGKSWEHLRTWNGQVFAIFKKACMARGFLEDDHEWRICNTAWNGMSSVIGS